MRTTVDYVDVSEYLKRNESPYLVIKPKNLGNSIWFVVDEPVDINGDVGSWHKWSHNPEYLLIPLHPYFTTTPDESSIVAVAASIGMLVGLSASKIKYDFDSPVKNLIQNTNGNFNELRLVIGMPVAKHQQRLEQFNAEVLGYRLWLGIAFNIN